MELDVGLLPPESAGDSPASPEDEALLADSVGLALYVVMDALTPAERVSFVLHDIFEVPFDAIAAALGRSTPGYEDAGQPGSRADPPGHPGGWR